MRTGSFWGDSEGRDYADHVDATPKNGTTVARLRGTGRESRRRNFDRQDHANLTPRDGDISHAITQKDGTKPTQVWWTLRMRSHRHNTVKDCIIMSQCLSNVPPAIDPPPKRRSHCTSAELPHKRYSLPLHAAARRSWAPSQQGWNFTNYNRARISSDEMVVVGLSRVQVTTWANIPGIARLLPLSPIPFPLPSPYRQQAALSPHPRGSFVIRPPVSRQFPTCHCYLHSPDIKTTNMSTCNYKVQGLNHPFSMPHKHIP